jgi:hypothetical protein
MRNNIFACIFFFLSLTAFAQFNNFRAEFTSTYSNHPAIPKGLLEAISYNKNTFAKFGGNRAKLYRITHLLWPNGNCKRWEKLLSKYSRYHC